MTLSIRARLTLWFSLLMTVALVLLGIGVTWLHTRWGRAQFDDELLSTGAAVSRVLHEELGERGNLQKAVEEISMSMEVPGRATAILDSGGQPIAAHWHGFPYGSTTLKVSGASEPYFATLGEGRDAWRVLLQHETSSAGDYTIVIAGTFEQLARQQSLLSRILFVATPLLVLVTAAVCWLVASSALRPVTIMAAQAEAITAHSIDRRLDAPAATDELGQLARAFNRLLTRLSSALQTQRQFMADASHELRTPVSVIQTAAEVTLEREAREGWEYREALTIVNEQSARLSRMVADMFLLARADAGGFQLTVRPLYLDEVVAECARAAVILATARGVKLVTHIQPDVSMSADDGLLRQLITNLLDNAVRHTPPGSSVTVSLAADSAAATITVFDTGRGIAPADRERVFDRFVRLDPARTSVSGAGLGLPIARWIAEQHRGTLTLAPNTAGGCQFVVRLPTGPGSLGNNPGGGNQDRAA